MKKPSLIKSILSFLLKVVVVFAIMLCIGVGSFQGVTKYLTGSFYDFKKASEDSEKESKTEATTEESVDEKSLDNSLLFVDSADGNYEYIILTILNKDTNAADLILIPEDAQVKVSKNIQKKLSKKIEGLSDSVEFRAIERSYSGSDQYDMISDILAEVLNLKISGWDHMTYENAVSFLGSVDDIQLTFDNDFTYRDSQGILHKISSGDTEIDAKQAMAYMSRLDGTDSQESDRLECVDTYMEKFLSRLISNKKASSVLEAYQKNLESSSRGRSFDNLNAVLKAANKSSSFITYRILQGSESDDVFDIDSQKAQLQVSTLIQQAGSYSSDDKLGNDSDDDSSESSFDESDSGDSKDLSIEIYNAAYVQGLASEWEYYLEDQGYNITLVDTYQEEGPLSTTKIVVKKDGIGEDLLDYFPDAEISVGDIDTGGDIQIYVGTDATDVGAYQ